MVKLRNRKSEFKGNMQLKINMSELRGFVKAGSL